MNDSGDVFEPTGSPDVLCLVIERQQHNRFQWRRDNTNYSRRLQAPNTYKLKTVTQILCCARYNCSDSYEIWTILVANPLACWPVGGSSMLYSYHVARDSPQMSVTRIRR